MYLLFLRSQNSKQKTIKIQVIISEQVDSLKQMYMKNRYMRKWDFKTDKRWDKNRVMSSSEELGKVTHLVIWKDYYQYISWCQGDLTSWRNSIPQVWEHKNLEGAIHSFSYHDLSLIRHSLGEADANGYHQELIVLGGKGM